MIRKISLILLIGITLLSLGFLLQNILISRQGTLLLVRMNTMNWEDERQIDKLILDFKPKYFRFLYPSLKSPDYREQLHAAYILARFGKKEDIAYLEGGLKVDDSHENNMATQLLWSLWFNGAGQDSRQILYECQRLMSRKKYDEAIGKLTKLVLRKPDFAEAYNQRALAYYLRGDYERSISDCRETLELNPIHFGSQSGMGECFMKLGRYEEARDAFETTLKITPYANGTHTLLEKTKYLLRKNSKHLA